MVKNVRSYWIQDINHLCPSHIAYSVKTLHSVPKFASKTQRIQVGNGLLGSVLFIIPTVIDIHGNRFEIFTLVSEIHQNVDLVLGLKNIFKLEGIINSWESCFSFLNMLIPFFSKVTNCFETKRAGIYKNRWNVRVSSNQNIR